MQYILTEEEYTLFKASQSNDNPIDDTKVTVQQITAYDEGLLRVKVRYRTKELALYHPEQFDGFLRVGSIEINPDWISNMDDDEWDELVDKIDAEYAELNEPLAIESNEVIVDVIPNDNVTLTFSEAIPYLECKLSQTTIRVYPKKFEKQAGDLDIVKYRIIDNGVINDLHLTAYQIRPSK